MTEIKLIPYGVKPKRLRILNSVKRFLAGWFTPPKYHLLKEQTDLSQFDNPTGEEE